MDSLSENQPPLPLQRSTSQHSVTSARSNPVATIRPAAGGSSAVRKLPIPSQPGSSANSIAASDKSLTSFPSFSPASSAIEGLDPDRNRIGGDAGQPRRDSDAWSQQQSARRESGGSRVGRTSSLVDSLTGSGPARDALFEDAPPRRSIPGAIHHAEDGHIERLIARHGAVALVRQIAEDLAHRDSQIAAMRRRADQRERALRRILRESGLSSMDLETRLRAVEIELRADDGCQNTGPEEGLSHLMSDAMQETMPENAFGETELSSSAIRTTSSSAFAANSDGGGRSTVKAWKNYFWGAGTAKKTTRSGSADETAVGPTQVTRSRSSLERRPPIQQDLFNPPNPKEIISHSVRSSSRDSSIHSGPELSNRRSSVSLASLALKLVAGTASVSRDAESRTRASSASGGAEGPRSSAAPSPGTKGAPSSRAASAAGGPRALMAMRRSTAAQAQASTRAQAQEMWGNMNDAAARRSADRQESYGPVEMDAILPPESQPPTLTHVYSNRADGDFLTDRFGFIYDQRRRKRQRESGQINQGLGRGLGRGAGLINGRRGTSSKTTDDVPSPKGSGSSDGQAESFSSLEETGSAEGKTKRWQDYLKIATFPTELLIHTPTVRTSTVEVTEAPGSTPEKETSRSSAITPTGSGLVPVASTTTAVDNETSRPAEAETTLGLLVREEAEPVQILLRQLSEVHDSIQRERTVKWNDFLRKVRAERRREGEAAVAAATAAAEARYEAPAMILPETRVADGEVIGVSGLGNKGKVGRAKWNEFRSLVLGGIPISHRAKIWSECSGANGLRVPGQYEDLVSQAGAEDDPTVVSQIQMDIHRTLTDNIFFRKGPGVQKLSEVLLAYSRRNREVGYCQGMNLIAANLLLIMPTAEDAFWILTSIIESILPPGYYDHSLMSSRADQQVLRQYVSAVLPKLSSHLDSLSIELEALTFQWFLSVFTDCLSAEALFRVWDVVLCINDGSTFLFQVALALLKLNEKNLLECRTPAGIYTYINHQMTEHAISIDGLIQASEGLRRLVRREDVEQRRDKAVRAERELLAERGDGMARKESGG